ncbi:glycosyltransferase family 39 protein [Devosia submarina]|uniref:glycosyltransferase family 39 protein n=1 Tax=Devosia submarina TaxID=1173082 RepID=UPI00130069D2|nr:glycosyltransferase family 39 protein [Devosia submarina]
MVAFAGLALAFALSQAIWVDETTQLSGLTLSFADQLGWLIGNSNPIPGVPPDRMPPLSYWLGALWAQCFGLSELSMRIFGIFAIACGAPAIFLAAREISPKSRLLPALALAIVYLAPGTIVQAGEIRAYPLFFSLSAWACLAYIRAISRSDEPVWLIGLGLFCVLAAYTHFFGVVMAGVLWLSLLLVRFAQKEPVFPVIVGCGIAIALCSGLVPFILASVRLSAGGSSADPSLVEAIREGARMAARLWMHGVHWSSPLLTALALLGMAILLVIAVVSLRRGSPLTAGLFLPLVLAMGLLNVLNLVIGGFNVLSPSYNIWLVPFLSLFALSALTVQWGRGLALFGAMCLTGAHLGADVQLMRHSSFYTHGPGDWLASEITDAESTIVVHDSSGNWGHVYFPLYYLTGGRLTQTLRDDSGAHQLIRPGGTAPFAGSVQDFDTQIYVRTRSLDSNELSARLIDPGDCGIEWMAPDDRREAEVRSYCAFEGATIAIVR